MLDAVPGEHRTCTPVFAAPSRPDATQAREEVEHTRGTAFRRPSDLHIVLHFNF